MGENNPNIKYTRLAKNSCISYSNLPHNGNDLTEIAFAITVEMHSDHAKDAWSTFVVVPVLTSVSG